MPHTTHEEQKGREGEVTASDTRQIANYLAVIHVSGSYPSGLHKGSSWSTDVMLGFSFDMASCRFVVKPELLPMIANHPLVRSVEALQAKGFKVDSLRITRYRRWTISKGVPMRHTEDLRDAYVMLDGRTRQCHDENGKWATRDLGFPHEYC